MRAFWIKVINILVIGVIIFVYQVGADTNARLNKAIGDLKTEIEEKKAEGAGIYTDGTYEGTGKGYKSEIKVRVNVKGGNITDITVMEQDDDPAYFGLASEIIDAVVDKQGTEGVDTVSGATYSSKGILEAVDDALEGASD